MPLLDINLNPSRRELRWFGAGILASSLAVGALAYWRGHAISISLAIWSLGGILGALYYLLPMLQRTIYLAFTYAVFPIGWCISHLMLLVAYYLVVTPIGLILRVLGRNPIHRDFDKSAQSYWIPRSKTSGTKRYFRQY